jgi:hypothetical protein
MDTRFHEARTKATAAVIREVKHYADCVIVSATLYLGSTLFELGLDIDYTEFS